MGHVHNPSLKLQRGPRLPQAARGTAIHQLTSVVDFLPTMLSAAGLEIPAGLDGLSLWPLFTNSAYASLQPPLRTELVLNIDNNPGDPVGAVNTAIISNGWKLIVGRQKFDGYYPVCNASGCPRRPASDEGESLFLFNLNESIAETTNYATSHPDVVAAMKARIAHHVSQRYVKPQSRKYYMAALPTFHNSTWAPWLNST